MNDERRTPRWLFDELNGIFDFTVDLAATVENTLVPAKFYTKEDSAFDHSWDDEVAWCNPPYSRGQLRRWVERATDQLGKTVMLLPGDCSTGASQWTLRHATVLFLGTRLAFDNEPSGAKFASWLALFNGSRRDVLNLADLELGVVL